MGYSHAASGLLVGVATLPIAPVTGAPAQTAWVVALGGAALIPDLDTSGSAAARMWGPLTRALGSGVGALAGGHRRGTHDAVLAPALFAAAAALACLHPVTAGVVLALTVGLALCGLSLCGAGRIGAAANLLLSAAAAWWLVAAGEEQVRVLPLVVAAGVLVHIAGDWLTVGGVPVPVLWLFGRDRRLSAALFGVDGPLERAVVAPLLSAAVVVLLCLRLGITGPASLADWVGARVQDLSAAVSQARDVTPGPRSAPS